MNTILVVDDDDVFRAQLRRSLEERGFRVVEASNTEGALTHAALHPPSHAVLDLRLGAESGIDLLDAFRERCPDTRVVMLTGYGSIPTAVEATRLGAANYLTKPAGLTEILTALDIQPETEGDDAATASTTRSAVPSLARSEWEHIHRVLHHYSGNISRAAEALRIPRRSLQRKLQKYPPQR